MDYSFRWFLAIYYGFSTVLDVSHVTVKRLSRTFRLNDKDVGVCIFYFLCKHAVSDCEKQKGSMI